MNMFKTLLNSIPKNRSEFVNELEIPEVTLEPYVWTEPEESLSVKSEQNSIVPESTDDDRATLSTDTSLPLSRAMTDSEIDYGLFRRLRSRSFCDPWDQMKAAMDAFPPEYVAALDSFQSHEPSSPEDLVATCAKERIRKRNDVLLARMRKYFKDDCCAFSPDDPAWLALEEALMERDGSEASAPESAHKPDSSPCDI